MKEVFLLPGHLVFTKEKIIVKTILGSCISVVMFDRVLNYSGVNHYLLPSGSPTSERYGDYAITQLFRSFTHAGSKSRDIVAHIYGGANVLAITDKNLNVGEANIECAHQLLNELKIRVVQEDIGGTTGRKIKVDTSLFIVKVSYNSDDKGFSNVS